MPDSPILTQHINRGMANGVRDVAVVVRKLRNAIPSDHPAARAYLELAANDIDRAAERIEDA